jgi:hypothetical protein
MTTNESVGLLALMGCLCALGAWLQWRRVPTVERREKQTQFRMALFMAAAFASFCGLGFFFARHSRHPCPSLCQYGRRSAFCSASGL